MPRLLSWLMPLALILGLIVPTDTQAEEGKLWVTYPGGEGPGKGKHIVLVSGDEEYRSEEALPQLGKILSVHHGYKCTVLFAMSDDGSHIDPNNRHNIPGLEALADADLMVVALRFRDLPDEQMEHIDTYLKSGRPVIGMRTSTHAFNIPDGKTYSHYSWKHKKGERDAPWSGGFGGFILGETWINHHGGHKKEGTNGIVVEKENKHPILKGIKDGDVWGDTDVYGVRLPLPGDSKPLVLGQVVAGLKPGGKPIDAKNNPMMPVAWVKSYQLPDGGKEGTVFTTTMGSSTDLKYMGTRRMLVNATYYLTEIDVPSGGAKNDLVGTFEPTMYAFKRQKGYWKGKNIKPSDFAIQKK
ncbi:MAG: hypothetical protein KTR15_06395 [Phycisphaeraceae bacterium]|nr:hypothetical protein [Phycisphaeraceae bacterium]